MADELAHLSDREIMVAMWRELSGELGGIHKELHGLRQGVAAVAAAQAAGAGRVDALISDTRALGTETKALGEKVLTLDRHVKNQMHLARERIRVLEAANG